jgi:hypothetical protein
MSELIWRCEGVASRSHAAKLPNRDRPECTTGSGVRVTNAVGYWGQQLRTSTDEDEDVCP